MPENPCRAKRDEYAAGGQEATSTRFQRRVHGIQTALSVTVSRAGQETGLKSSCNTRIVGQTRTQHFHVVVVMLHPPVPRV